MAVTRRSPCDGAISWLDPAGAIGSQVQIARSRAMKTLATGLLVLLSVLVAESSIAQQGINAPPDAIFYNGKIITVDSGFTVQQAFAVRGEQYVAVGRMLQSKRSQARILV